MLIDQASQNLLKKIVNLDNKHGYRCDQYFSWMIDDVLADLGIKKNDIPPQEVLPELFNLSKAYAKVVIDSDPFTDVLGSLYMELSSRYKQKSLGQYFTPWPIALMMSKILYGNTDPDKGKLTSVCDPACGSGIMLLAFAHNIVTVHGNESLPYFSFTGIDLDRLCARITACQFLTNAFIHQLTYGELLIYQGNALADLTDLNVVVHATRADLPESQFIPAKAKCREPAIKEAAKASNMNQTNFDF